LLQRQLAGNDDRQESALFAMLWQDRVRRILIEHFTDPRLVSFT